VADRSHLSIGEVLSLLREEFPDVTISKIRFLESQGLVDPERTPSGYRKFYDHDVDRLRWILRQQRENFLPLKVIKGRLSDEDTGGLESPVAAEDPTSPALAAVTHGDPSGPLAVPAPEGREVAAGGARPAPVPAPPPAPASVPVASAPAAPGTDAEDESLTLDELAARSGLEASQLEELARFGLITVQSRSGGLDYYDQEALAVATVAAGFARHGVEARHLRAWRNAAEREVSVFEQVVIPHLRQRNPQARAQAQEALDELSDLGATLRAVLVRRGIREVR
jgi:DNA-binding transcriptional MerR regulator